MNDQSDPTLSPEERALAARLARLGPHDGPPPALDARILAAARAAAAAAPSRRRRRRRFVLSGLPASLVTAAGTAAALVLAVGVVWQLRPVDRPPLPRHATPGTSDDGFVIAEIVAPRRGVPPAGSSPAAPTTPSPSRDGTAAGAPARRAARASETAVTASAERRAATVPSAAAPPAAPGAAPEPRALDSVEVTGSRAAPSDAMAFDGNASAEARAAAEAEIAESAARRHASYTTAALAKAERATRARQDGAAASSAPAVAASTGTSAAGALADVPIEADAELPPADWLRRVRARRDQGDLDGARDSLRRFREAHPGVRIPFDLRRLLR